MADINEGTSQLAETKYVQEEFVNVLYAYEADQAKPGDIIANVGRMGENLDDDLPLFSNLSKAQSHLPEVSMLGSEKSILRKHIYNKVHGHELPRKDLVRSPARFAVSQRFSAADDSFVVLDMKPTTLGVAEKDGTHQYLPMKIETDSPGLIIQALVSTSTRKLVLNARGTSDLETLKTDFENGGPAVESFERDAVKILEQVDTLSATCDIQEIEVCGHSLGGVIAQMIIHRLVAAKAQNCGLNTAGQYQIPANVRSNLSKVTKIEGHVHNAAGIPKSMADDAKSALKYLKEHEPNTQVGMHYTMVDGDPVQQMGEATIFSDVSSDQAITSLLKYKSGYKKWALPAVLASSVAGAEVGAMLGSLGGPIGVAACAVVGGTVGLLASAALVVKPTHCNHFFTEDRTSKLEYEIATNETEKGRAFIHEKVGNKSSLVNNIVTQALQHEIVTTARKGGWSAVVGGVTGVVGGVAAAVTLAPVVGTIALTGAIVGGVAGAIGAHRLSNAVCSAASSVKNYFWSSTPTPAPVAQQPVAIEMTQCPRPVAVPVTQPGNGSMKNRVCSTSSSESGSIASASSSSTTPGHWAGKTLLLSSSSNNNPSSSSQNPGNVVAKSQQVAGELAALPKSRVENAAPNSASLAFTRPKARSSWWPF